jgi:hypothetical protein
VKRNIDVFPYKSIQIIGMKVSQKLRSLLDIHCVASSKTSQKKPALIETAKSTRLLY